MCNVRLFIRRPLPTRLVREGNARQTYNGVLYYSKINSAPSVLHFSAFITNMEHSRHLQYDGRLCTVLPCTVGLGTFPGIPPLMQQYTLTLMDVFAHQSYIKLMVTYSI